MILRLGTHAFPSRIAYFQQIDPGNVLTGGPGLWAKVVSQVSLVSSLIERGGIDILSKKAFLPMIHQYH